MGRRMFGCHPIGISSFPIVTRVPLSTTEMKRHHHQDRRPCPREMAEKVAPAVE